MAAILLLLLLLLVLLIVLLLLLLLLLLGLEDAVVSHREGGLLPPTEKSLDGTMVANRMEECCGGLMMDQKLWIMPCRRSRRLLECDPGWELDTFLQGRNLDMIHNSLMRTFLDGTVVTEEALLAAEDSTPPTLQTPIHAALGEDFDST